jgi:hypothetical protein
MVTTRRSSAAATGSPRRAPSRSPAPQDEQNAALAGASAPHTGQSWNVGAPHALQKRAPASCSAPHDWQTGIWASVPSASLSTETPMIDSVPRVSYDAFPGTVDLGKAGRT